MNLKEKFARMKELQAQKKKIYDEVDKITKPLGDLKKEQDAKHGPDGEILEYTKSKYTLDMPDRI